jgi:uncharacterized protein YuzE
VSAGGFMKLIYNKSGDVMYLEFQDAKVSTTQIINDHIIVDLDESGHVVGIEINGVSLANINPYVMTVEYDTNHADERPNTVVETG